MPSLDMNLINDLRELMEDEFNALVEIYLNDSSVRIEQISAAVAAADGAEIRHTAHSLKGSSSNIGAAGLASLCQSLEEMGKNNQLDNSSAQLQLIKSELLTVQNELRALMG
jgi:HPt (histidine-containing phosphotransfer) domain-containing protein